MTTTHDAHVDRQFGEQAAAYLTSKVHAAGEDLGRIAALLSGQETAVVLDLGCGAGHVAFAVAPHVARVVACDLSPRMLAVVADAAASRGLRNIETREGVAAALPFADASFDWVLSRYSAHHWPDLGAGLAAAARVLRPGGRAVFVDTIAPAFAKHDSFLQAIEIMRDPSHVRNRSRAEWVDAAARAGFAIDGASEHRVRLDFAPWTERMRTPPVLAQAILALQADMPDEVRAHFAVGADGSFTVDKLFLELVRA